MRFFVLRILLPLLLFLVLRYVLRAVFKSSSEVAHRRGGQPEPPATGGALKKDPVCGTYVTAASGITHQVRGETLYFCSEECRKKYRAA